MEMRLQERGKGDQRDLKAGASSARLVDLVLLVPVVIGGLGLRRGLAVMKRGVAVPPLIRVVIARQLAAIRHRDWVTGVRGVRVEVEMDSLLLVLVLVVLAVRVVRVVGLIGLVCSLAAGRRGSRCVANYRDSAGKSVIASLC